MKNLAKEKEQIKRKIQFSLLSTNNTSLVGEIGEIIAKHYLQKKMKFTYLHKFSLHGSEREWIKRTFTDKDKIEYLMDYRGRYWDLIGVKRQYKSRYGRKRVEKADAELRSALREKEEEKAKAVGFRVLLVTVTLLSDWKFECEHIEL